MTPHHFWRSLRMRGRVASEVRDVLAGIRNRFVADSYAKAYLAVRPYTMSGNARLKALYDSVERVAAGGIPGDVVECGAARGGSAALLGLAIRDFGFPRRLWVFDTFEGIPAPTAADPDYDIAVQYTGQFRGELQAVADLMQRLGITEDVRLIKGRFEETLRSSNTGHIAVLHIDGDWYQSVRTCLDSLYDRVSSGGIIQIDDYGHWAGARKAVEEFLSERDLPVHLGYVDYTGRQFTKP